MHRITANVIFFDISPAEEKLVLGCLGWFPFVTAPKCHRCQSAEMD